MSNLISVFGDKFSLKGMPQNLGLNGNTNVDLATANELHICFLTSW